MRRRAVLWSLAYLAATAVFVAGVVVLVRGGDDGAEVSSTGDVASLASMPFPTRIAAPVTKAGTVGSQIPISVASHGEAAVASVTLYDGGTVIARTAPTSDPSRVEMTFPALSVGPHLVHAQVVDTEGATSLTAPVPIEVASAPAAPPAPDGEDGGGGGDQEGGGVGAGDVEVLVEPLEDETPADLATRLSIDPERVGVVADPRSPGDVPFGRDAVIPPGAVVSVVIPPDHGLDVLDAAEPVVVEAPSSISKGPALDAEVVADDDCGATLRNTGDDEVTVYGQDAGSVGWGEVGTIGGGRALDLGSLAPGNHTYFARGSGGDGAPVGVRAPMRCGEDMGWTGDVSIVDGVITSPGGQPVWLFLSVDGRPWQRVPAGQEEYLSLSKVDSIAEHLPALDGAELSVEMWQWHEFPQRIGSGKLVVPEGTSLGDVVGDPSAVTLEPTFSRETFLALTSANQELSFSWTAASPHVEEVLWQVLSERPSIGDTDLNPAQLLGAGVSQRSSTDAGGQGTGTFTIDTADIPRAPTGDEGRAAPPADGLGSTTAVLTPIVDRTVGSIGAGSFATPVAPGAGAEEKIDAYLALPGPGDPVWIRVVTNPNGPGAPTASTFASVTLPVPQSVERGQVTFTVDSVVADLGRAPNPALFGCVDVVVPWPQEAPWHNASGVGYWQGLRSLDPNVPIGASRTPDYELGRQAQASHYYPTSGTYCPSDFPQDEVCQTWYCDLWYGVVEAAEAFAEVVGTLYDLVAYMYNTAIDELVWVIGELNLGCKLLSGASAEAVEYCKEGSRWIGRAVITVVLSYYGLPARLPERAAAAQLAEGELAPLAVEVMKYYGVPCDDIKTDPALVEGLSELAKQGGVEEGDTDDFAAVAEDPCLAVAKAAIAFIKKEIQAAAEASTAAATGMPYFPGIAGFEFRPNAESLPESAFVSVTASPKHADADATGARCLASIRDPGAKGIKGPGPYAWKKFELTEQPPIDGKGTWFGSVVLPTYASPADLVALQGLTIEAQVWPDPASVCYVTPASTTASIGPPSPKGG